ncbi:MAG: hypothetical protein WC001_08965 [Desulfurivibrionaceae bacterium]
MARKKEYVLSALSDAHLRGIGKVAAQWSSLEYNILRVITDIARTDHKTTLVMLAAQGFTSWCEILKALSGDVTPKPKPQNNTPTVLETLITEMTALHRHRNSIVHCSWDAPFGLTPGMGLIGAYPLPTPKSHEKAKGSGLKKRQADPLFAIEYSAKEMLSISRKIDKAQTALLSWRRQWLREHGKETAQ